jgi:hypothetical protein
MEEFIDEKIKEIGERVGPISFDKGTDNYNTMKKILIETYSKGQEDIDELFIDIELD